MDGRASLLLLRRRLIVLQIGTAPLEHWRDVQSHRKAIASLVKHLKADKRLWNVNANEN